MRVFYKISVHQYVTEIIHHRKIMTIIEEWNIEYETIVGILIAHFESLGIYEINPVYHEEIILQSIFHQLKYSPEINQRLEKLRRRQEEESSRLKHKEGS